MEKQKETEYEEKIKAMLEALNDALECLDDDNDIEGAVADLNAIQKNLRELLPAIGAYAWIKDGMDKRKVKVFSSVKEAEERLIRDIDQTIEDLDDLDDTCTMPHRDTLKNDVYEVTARDGSGYVLWKRMYSPTLTQD